MKGLARPTSNNLIVKMKFLLRTIALAGGLSVVPLLHAETRTFNVRDFGAKGDGTTLDTAAIQKAFDDCGKAGGGTVRLPKGVYLSQPLVLRTKTTLSIDEDATLKATDDPKDYLPS